MRKHEINRQQKSPSNLGGSGLGCSHNRKATMSNITHITQANQVQISEHQLGRFVEFIENTENGFDSLQTLVRLIMEKSERHTTAYTLASITWDKLDDWMTACHKEVEYFKQHSPKVAGLVLKECAA